EHLTPGEVAQALDDKVWVHLPDVQNQLSGEGDGGEWWTLDASDIDNTADLPILERRTGHKVAVLAHDGTVHAVAISREGNWIATASGDHDILLWPWDQKTLIELACARLPRNLTREEWQRHNLEELEFGSYRATCPNVAFNR